MAATGAEPPRCPTAIETARLILRPPAEADIPRIAELAAPWEIARFTANIPHPYTPAHAAQWIAATARAAEAGKSTVFAVTERANGAFIGSMGVLHDPAPGTGEIAYWLGQPYWGRGYAAEAGAAVLRFAFEELRLERLVAHYLAENETSGRLLARLGFERTGTLQRMAAARGRVFDLISVALTAAAWRARKPRKTVLVAAVALVDADGRVLIARRPAGKEMAGLWEFPGGKVREGETPEAALIREVEEELGIDISASCLAPFAFASHAYDDFHLLMPLYLCRKWAGTVTARERQALKWARPETLRDYPMPPADVPLVAMLRDFL
jgi:8-oxo-dGTP diphosphatase